MKTNTLQNKLKKMQLFFKKSLLFEKIIISLHSSLKSSTFAVLSLLEILPRFSKSRFRMKEYSQFCGFTCQIYGLWKTSKSGYVNPRF